MTAQPHDNPNIDLLERIPLSAQVVLDVGCSTGVLGAAYRRLNPHARLLGIDRNEAAAAVAKQRLDEVAVVDVDKHPLPFVLDRPIDCIVYGDVLEHMRDPWAVMRRHAEALSDDGTMVICVPNLEHWSFVDRLLRGTWRYEQSGLLDDTHLRWFSLETMREGLGTLGLSPCDVKPRIFDGQAAAAFATKIAPALVALGVDPSTYAQRSAPLQYVWRVRKRLQPRLSIVSSMLEPVGGVSHVRIAYPLQALRTDAMISTHFSSKGESTSVAGDTPRIFMLHRPSLAGEAGASRIRRLLSEGWVIVTEFDDHPDHFGMLNSDDQYAFSGVHAVQTSTLALASVLRRLNPEVAVFSNMIPSLPEVSNFTDPNVMTLFFGALNREQDWAPLMPALNAAAEKVGGRLRFCVVHDQGFFDGLRTPHKQFTPTCDHDTYMTLLGRCEISFMPLADTAFNRAKSDLKFIEAGACQVASLASHIVYADSIEDGRTGLLFRDADQLRDRLLRLVAMPGLAQGLASAARNYVAGERMLAYQVAPRIAWYRSLWARREELTNALYSRLANRPQQGRLEPLRRPAEFGALS